ncbi:MAG: methylated-DNA--[protein]-cysteine S-methyltransferase [Candidatus Hermodarchaeota archaeon]
MKTLYYYTFSSSFDTFTIVWEENDSGLLIKRIFLSDPEQKSEEKVKKHFKQVNSAISSPIELLGDKIQGFLNGEDVQFSFELIDFTICSEIQEIVLKEERRIPRGWVSTYKRIANHIGLYNGARAVGNALARNPFPIIIPCHRAIKSNGDLGGYQGGITMKRKLLEMEGIEFSSSGQVITERIFY